MGLSNFTTMPDKKISGFAGKQSSVPMYLQFVTGYCSEVLHSSENPYHDQPNHTNSIIAVAHHSDKIFKTKATSVSDEDRYYPLLRTMHDVPTKGDTVLLTNFAGVNYYLGPINMDTNSPTWNQSRFKSSELSIPTSKSGETTERAANGESKNFNKIKYWNRLSKFRKEDLDYGPTINECVGDFILEGRHGNSIRVGSRDINPYIFISNERPNTNVSETLGDGSLISITSNGTLQQHFGKYPDVVTKTSLDGFKLASDLPNETNDENKYTIGGIYSNFKNNIDSSEIYNYQSNQMLLHSDRIIINSKVSDTFISSRKDTYIGSSENLFLTSPISLNIDSNNVNIGNSKRENVVMESMVLGDKLKEILTELFTELKAATSLFYGSPLPLMDQTGGTPLSVKLSTIEAKLKDLLSKKHKIEQG